jgi:4-diphosphocytidyl-2C-methyl-D-erythritol kinase
VQGIGNIIKSVTIPKKMPILLINPKTIVLTKDVFANLGNNYIQEFKDINIPNNYNYNQIQEIINFKHLPKANAFFIQYYYGINAK